MTVKRKTQYLNSV